MIPRSIIRRFKPTTSIPSTLRQPASTYLQPRLLSQRIPAPARARIAARWYADDARAAEKGASDESLGDAAPKDGAKGAEPTVEDPMKKELEGKNKEIAELKDRYLRQVADFRNLQERTKKDMESTRNFAIQKFAKDLIESVDTFDLALSQVSPDKLQEPSSSSAPAAGNAGSSPGDAAASASSEAAPAAPQAGPDSADPYKELRQLHSGLRMTESILMNTLKKHGLERFDPSPAGEKFDPNIHEATFQTPQPDKVDGTCFYTTQKGFTLNGRTLRAAKVGVVKNS